MWQRAPRDHVQVLTWVDTSPDDGFSGPDLKALVTQVTAEPGQSWVIDASGIASLSSESIALLIGLVRSTNLAGGKMVLAGPVASVATVLRMTRLTRILPIHDDVEQAVTALA